MHDYDDVKECIQNISDLGVEVHENINREELSRLTLYDIVIVVAHRDPFLDMLILSDDIMSMDEFVNLIPADFSGVLDFSSCYSATAFDSIKQRCPKCKVQLSLSETTLLRRLIIYPSLIELLNDTPSIAYDKAYNLISAEFDTQATELKSSNSDNPHMAHLGKRMSSIYAPKKVVRKSPFQILIFFYYDSERQAVEIKAKRWQTDSELRDEFFLPINSEDCKELSVTLSVDAWNEKSIVLKGNEYTRMLTLKDNMTVERYVMMVMPDFEEDSFIINLDFEADEVDIMHCSFNIKVGKEGEKPNPSPATVVAETPDMPSDINQQLRLYGKTCCQQWMGEHNIKRIERLLLSGNADTDRLRAIRKLLFDNNLFINQIESRINKLNIRLTELLKSIDISTKKATTDLAPIQILQHYTSKLTSKVQKLKNRFSKMSESNFQEIEAKFHAFGSGFLIITSEINNIGNQFDMLDSFRQLKYALVHERNDKEQIKRIASEFLEHPTKHATDKPIYDIFKAGGTSSIKHSTSNGATLPYLALCIAMALGRYDSIDNGKEDWKINVTEYIDFSRINNSLRTHKGRINKTLALLNDERVKSVISSYRLTEAGKISTTAYYLQQLKVNIRN